MKYLYKVYVYFFQRKVMKKNDNVYLPADNLLIQINFNKYNP